MSRKTSLNISHVFCAGLALAAIVVSLGAQSATAASADHRRLGKPLPHRHHFYAIMRLANERMHERVSRCSVTATRV